MPLIGPCMAFLCSHPSFQSYNTRTVITNNNSQAVASCTCAAQYQMTAMPGTKIDNRWPQPLYQEAMLRRYSSRNAACFGVRIPVFIVISAWRGMPSDISVICDLTLLDGGPSSRLLGGLYRRPGEFLYVV